MEVEGRGGKKEGREEGKERGRTGIWKEERGRYVENMTEHLYGWCNSGVKIPHHQNGKQKIRSHIPETR